MFKAGIFLNLKKFNKTLRKSNGRRRVEDHTQMSRKKLHSNTSRHINVRLIVFCKSQTLKILTRPVIISYMHILVHKSYINRFVFRSLLRY
jgi:hypothetical protein